MRIRWGFLPISGGPKQHFKIQAEALLLNSSGAFFVNEIYEKLEVAMESVCLVS